MEVHTPENGIDEIGEEILESIANADRFNRWMYETIKPWCKGKVMEMGSGVGNISHFFIKDDFKIFLTDLRPHYCKVLEEKYSVATNLLGVDSIDMVHPEFSKIYAHHFDSYDTVFALNVIEHIQEDALAISNCKKLLSKGGHLIILVPAHQFLYNKLDEALGHFKRYNPQALTSIFREQSLEILHQQYFNFPGIFAWWLNKFKKNGNTITKSQMDIYNRLVPIFKFTDKITMNSIGLSRIIVGRNGS